MTTNISWSNFVVRSKLTIIVHLNIMFCKHFVAVKVTRISLINHRLELSALWNNGIISQANLCWCCLEKTKRTTLNWARLCNGREIILLEHPTSHAMQRYIKIIECDSWATGGKQKTSNSINCDVDDDTKYYKSHVGETRHKCFTRVKMNLCWCSSTSRCLCWQGNQCLWLSFRKWLCRYYLICIYLWPT